ncbi:IS4/Tn5 family transposase DNA-binding protein [Nostoc favosum]
MSVLLSLGYALSLGFGIAPSEIFNSGTVLKRAYEFLPRPLCSRSVS